MDVDGLLLLMDKDRDLFLKWREDSKNFSLEELKNSYNEWLVHYNETYEKYKNLQTGDAMKDAPLMCAEFMYFHELGKYTLHALTAYTAKLREEYDLIRKPVKSKTKKKRIRTKR